MGLAASQARFLAITARKANCEFQSMTIAQEKLSITRDLQTATNQYQDKINSTKLVWDPTGDGNNVFQLTYDLMMTPSAENGYDPYLLTDRTGAVVLNGKMAAAAKIISPDGRTVPRSEQGRNEFLNALATTGYISGSLAESITNGKNNYIKGAGMGAEPLDKTAANAVTKGTLADILSDSDYKFDFENIFMSYSGGSLGTHNFNGESQNLTNMKWDFNGRAESSLAIQKNGKNLTQDELKNLTLGDLLSDEYTLLMAMPDNMTTTNGEIPGVTNSVNGNDTLLLAMAKMLGYGSSGTDGLVTDDASREAVNFAYAQCLLLLKPENNYQVSNPSSTSKSYQAVVNNTKNYNTYVNTGHHNLNKKENSHIGLSLSNLMESFLTYYAQALGGYDTGFSVGKSEKNSVKVTDDPSYYYVLNNNSAITEIDLLMTDFYNMLYNNICASGWTTNEFVDDPEYLAHAVKNGQMFISSLHNDGRYYQGPYTENGYVVEVTDDDAIAQAEREYSILKTKLNFKEEKLELDMKNLDLEISSLTTEYDSVKNILSKNVEKIFTMFGN